MIWAGAYVSAQVISDRVPPPFIKTGFCSSTRPSPFPCSLSAKYAQTMPYELRALEVALATVTATLESEVCRLEARAYPVVDRLTSDVSRGGDGRRLRIVLGVRV